jgi:GT2 family glycosyltransferase
MQIRVLFIIPVLARGVSDQRLLIRCLKSIQTFDPLMLAHTLIVEEAESLPVTWCKDVGCRHVKKMTAAGYSSSINIGIMNAAEHGYTHVVTINQDIEFVQPILVPFMRAFRYGDIAGGTLYYPTGKIQSAGWFYRDDGMPLEYEKYLHSLSAKEHERERFVGGITGALQGFSLSCGYYDEKFDLGYEDVEFCLRNLQAGKKIFYTPTIRAVHVESAIRGSFPGEAEIASFDRYKSITDGTDFGAINQIFNSYNLEYEQR